MDEAAARAFYDRQLELLAALDADKLVDSQYNDDAVLISFQKTVRGHEALKVHFRQYLAMLGQIKLKSTDNFTFTDDGIFFEASMSTKLGDAKVYDAWAMRDGKIASHFTGVK